MRLCRTRGAAAHPTPCRLNCPHEPLLRPRRCSGPDSATSPDLPMRRCRARGAAAALTLRRATPATVRRRHRASMPLHVSSASSPG
eukprot:scaffold54268_cov69-Phaeocystis_antarctica.AAC.2